MPNSKKSSEGKGASNRGFFSFFGKKNNKVQAAASEATVSTAEAVKSISPAVAPTESQQKSIAEIASSVGSRVSSRKGSAAAQQVAAESAQKMVTEVAAGNATVGKSATNAAIRRILERVRRQAELASANLDAAHHRMKMSAPTRGGIGIAAITRALKMSAVSAFNKTRARYASEPKRAQFTERGDRALSEASMVKKVAKASMYATSKQQVEYLKDMNAVSKAFNNQLKNLQKEFSAGSMSRADFAKELRNLKRTHRSLRIEAQRKFVESAKPTQGLSAVRGIKHLKERIIKRAEKSNIPLPAVLKSRRASSVAREQAAIAREAKIQALVAAAEDKATGKVQFSELSKLVESSRKDTELKNMLKEALAKSKMSEKQQKAVLHNMDKEKSSKTTEQLAAVIRDAGKSKSGFKSLFSAGNHKEKVSNSKTNGARTR